jgi:excisionase family DNA binding protein
LASFAMTNRDTPLTAYEIREILAEALTGVVHALRRPQSRSDPRQADPTEPNIQGVGSLPTGRLALSLSEVAEALGVGRTMVYHLTSSGQLPSVQIGKRRLIPVHVLDEWIRALPMTADEFKLSSRPLTETAHSLIVGLK